MLEVRQSIEPNPKGFAADPLGYSALGWHKWAMAQTLAGYSIDLERGPSSEDLKSPVLWLAHAHAMSEGARVLLQGAPDLNSMPESVRGVCHCQYHAIGLMLVGYSLEICLKAMIIIRKGVTGYQSEEKQHRHHSLEKLAEFIPDLSDKDNAILKGLSHFVRWAGRYPDPGFGKERFAKEIFLLSESHKICAKDLFVLASRVMAYVRCILEQRR